MAVEFEIIPPPASCIVKNAVRGQDTDWLDELACRHGLAGFTSPAAHTVRVIRPAKHAGRWLITPDGGAVFLGKTKAAAGLSIAALGRAIDSPEDAIRAEWADFGESTGSETDKPDGAL